MNAFLGTCFLDTGAAANSFRPEAGLTSFADILQSPLLASVFTSAPCSVCMANDLPTVGPTFFDSETQGRFCLGCLELACEPLPEDAPEDQATVAYAEKWIASRRAA